MAMTPAEPSRPWRKWSGRGASTWAGSTFWSVAVFLFFVLGLYLTAHGALPATSFLVTPLSLHFVGR